MSLLSQHLKRRINRQSNMIAIMARQNIKDGETIDRLNEKIKEYEDWEEVIQPKLEAFEAPDGDLKPTQLSELRKIYEMFSTSEFQEPNAGGGSPFFTEGLRNLKNYLALRTP